MTRAALAFDRVVTLLAGIGLTALGLSAVAWEQGALAGGRSLSLSIAHDATRTDWWPWASGGVGVLLVVIGARWLFSHRPARKASRVGLRTVDGERFSPITADVAAVASAAATALARDPAIVKASGVAHIDRGRPTVTLNATVLGRNGLHAGAHAADDTAREIFVMLGDTVSVRTVLRIDTRHRHGTVR